MKKIRKKKTIDTDIDIRRHKVKKKYTRKPKYKKNWDDEIQEGK